MNNESKTLISNENYRRLRNLADKIQKNLNELDRFPARLKRYSLARDQALINLKQINETISDLESFLMFSDESETLNTSERLRRFNRLSKLDKLNTLDRNLASYVGHLRYVRQKMATCGEYLTFKECTTTGKIRLVNATFCNVHLLCPLCAIRRSARMLKAYIAKYEIIKQKYPDIKLSMLTITVKNGYDLKERLDHFKKSSTKLHDYGRRAKLGQRGYSSEFEKVLGSFGSIEVTKDNGYGENKDTGWHVHGHFIVLHDRNFDFTALKAEWLKITRDSDVVNVRAIDQTGDVTQDFMTVFRYITKSSEPTQDHSELTPEQTMELYEVARGMHLCATYGIFRGITVPESLLDEEQEDATETGTDKLYRHSSGSGYNQVA